jgi:hypothetical protein
MFASWAGEHIFESGAKERREQQIRDIDFVSGEMGKAITWMLAYQNELRKDKPDDEILANSARNYGGTVGKALAAMSQVNPDSPVLRKHVEIHGKMMKDLNEAVDRRDVKQLRDVTAVMMVWVNQAGAEAEPEKDKAVEEVKGRMDRGEMLFKCGFLAASAVLLISWVWKAALGMQPGGGGGSGH